NPMVARNVPAASSATTQPGSESPSTCEKGSDDQTDRPLTRTVPANWAGQPQRPTIRLIARASAAPTVPEPECEPRSRPRMRPEPIHEATMRRIGRQYPGRLGDRRRGVDEPSPTTPARIGCRTLLRGRHGGGSMTPEQLGRLRVPSDPRLHPDG